MKNIRTFLVLFLISSIVSYVYADVIDNNILIRHKCILCNETWLGDPPDRECTELEDTNHFWIIDTIIIFNLPNDEEC